MPKKYICIMIIMTVLFISSCSDQEGNQNSGASANPEESQNTVQTTRQTPVKQDNSSVTIHIYSFQDDIKDAINQFNTSSKVGIIEPIYITNDLSGEYQKKLEADLASGAGPDIIMSNYYYFPHLLKLIQNGTLYNLNEYIKNDEELDIGNFNEQALESGVINSSRYFIPLSYSVNGILFTTDEIIEEIHFQQDDRYISMNDLALMAEEYMKTHAGEETCFIDYFHPQAFGISPNLFSNSVELDHTRIINYMDNHKSIYDSTYYAGASSITMDNTYFSLLPDRKIAFAYGDFYGFDSISQYYKRFDKEVDPEIYASTIIEGEKTVSASPCVIVAINSNCSNRKAAYEFIKVLLGCDIQRRMNFGFPVNIEAYESQKEAYIKKPGQFASNPLENVSSFDPNLIGGILESESAEYYVRQIQEIVNGNLDFELIDGTMSGIMQKAVDDVNKGIKIPQAAVNDMKEDIENYLKADISEYIKPIEAPSDIPTITIQYFDGELSVHNAIRSFNEKRQDIRIEGTVYPYSSRDEFTNKLTTSIMSGEGPDIVYFDGYMFNSLEKTISTGVFCDLNPFIANDHTFKELDLNENVIDAGVINGKRVYMPLRYQLPILISTKSIMEESRIRIDESSWSLDQLKSIIINNVGNAESKYFVNSTFLYRFILNGCGMDFINHENKKANFQSRDFINLMKFYKDIYPYIMPAEVDYNADISAALIKNHSIVMDFDYICSPENLWSTNSIYHGLLGEDPLIYPLPQIKPYNDIPVEIMNMASINQNCSNKQAALDFIEELLSENIQCAEDKFGNSNITYGFPVNNKALREELIKYKDPSYAGRDITISNSNFAHHFITVTMPESLESRITELTNRAVAGPSLDLEVYKIISEGLRSYLDGKQTAEEAARDIDNKVNLFLNE